MFTVKVDLSSVMDNLNGHQMYILLVDPCKMKVVFEFKKWIQFLFSVDFCIRLVYEDAVIHDLEDINILSLLKSVKIEQSVPPKWANKVHDLLAEKNNKFDEMFNTKILKALIDKSDINLKSGDSTDIEFCSPQMNYSGLSIDGSIHQTLERSLRNMTKEKVCSENGSQNIVSPDEKKAFCQETQRDKDIQYCSISPCSEKGFQIADDKKLNCGWKKNESNDNFDMKRKNFASTEVDSESFTRYKTKKVSEVDNIQEDPMNSNQAKNLDKQLSIDNSTNGETHTLVEDLKIQNKKLPKIFSQYKNKNFIKPFCIGSMLNEMRAENLCKTDQNNSTKEHTDSLLSVSEFANDGKMPFHNENNNCQNHITYEKKIRKRIRQHKSKRKNTYCELSNTSVSSPISFSLFSKSSNHNPLNSGQKPKHIRFDLDVNEVDLDHFDNQIKSDANCQEYNEIKSSSNDSQKSKRLSDINVQELRDMIQEKRKTLELNCNNKVDTDRNSNCSDLISSDGYCSNQKKIMENQFLEVQNSFQVEEKKNEQDMLETEFPKSIFDITTSSGKKYSNPFVFNRFN